MAAKKTGKRCGDPRGDLRRFAYRVQTLARKLEKRGLTALEAAKAFVAEEQQQGEFFTPRNEATRSTQGTWHALSQDSLDVSADLRLAGATFRTAINEGYVQRSWPPGYAGDRESQLDAVCTVARRLTTEVLVDGRLPTAASERVQLFERDEPPIVDGNEVPILSKAQYDVIRALLDAGANGLSGAKLNKKSGHGDSRKTLGRVAALKFWRDVIVLPGKANAGGHRIK